MEREHNYPVDRMRSRLVLCPSETGSSTTIDEVATDVILGMC